jgi:hypothetical protein
MAESFLAALEMHKEIKKVNNIYILCFQVNKY